MRRLGALGALAAIVASFGAFGALGALSASNPLAAAPSPGYVAIAPVRVLDTRAGFGVPARPSGRSTPPQPVTVSVPSVPADAAAVVVNVTVTEPVAGGYATVYPCGKPVPLVSNVNFRVGRTVANLVIAKPGESGQICMVTNVAAHLVADLQGWFPAGTYLANPVPVRLLDTRAGARRVTAGQEVVLTTDGSGDADVLNVTVTDPSRPGYLTVYPCGTTPPFASNLNFSSETVANLVLSAVGPVVHRRVCASASADVHLVVDAQGQLPAGSDYRPITPVRMVDTRSPIGVNVAALRTAGQVTTFSFPVMSGIPPVVSAVAVNVTATDATSAGYVSVYPCGARPPTASNINVGAGETRPNLVIVPLLPGGTICATSNIAVHLVADLQGWFVGGNAPAVSPRQRLHVDLGTPASMGYLAYLPEGYASSPGRTWPTIVFLHGSGQAGSGTGNDLDDVASTGLPRLIEAGQLPAAARNFIVLAPQIPNAWHDPVRLGAWLDQVLANYRVDRDRLYLTGLSLGAYGVFEYLGTYGNANEFAAMVPIAGEYTHDIACVDWRRTPLWAFHGEADDSVDVTGSIDAVLTVNDTCSPAERLRLTTFPGVGHNSWDLTYGLAGMGPGLVNPSYDPYDVDVYTWMLAHVRSRTR